MHARQNYRKRSGDTLAFLYRAWTDATKTTALDITGSRLVVTLQPANQPNAARVSVTAYAIDNQIRATFAPAVTAPLSGAYEYDMVVVLADGSEFTRMDGVIVFERRIKAAVG